MKYLMLAAVLAACGGSKHGEKGSGDDARCATFADRVVECAFDKSVTPPMSPEEQKSVREKAYAVCTKTTDDPDVLHYYGDVDKKITCMQGKDCAGVRTCLTAD